VVSALGERLAVTPTGLRPASCVFGPISTDHVVVNFATHSEIQNGNGDIIQTIKPCEARTIDPEAPLPPDGWNAYVWDMGTSPTFNQYNGTWSVPVNPKDKGTQTLFLFTGFQDLYGLDRDAPSVTNIIQPVLQFGTSEAGGGTYWAMASWYVDSNGNAYYSQLTNTLSGHTIQGNMVRNPTTKVWEIETIDTNTNKMTTLNIATNTTEPYAFVTLEVYTVANCGEYPTGSVPFTNLVFKPAFTPSWTVVSEAGCSENVVVNSPSSVTIDF
jgi:hypothetical protein